jgi:hypothetical protein
VQALHIYLRGVLLFRGFGGGMVLVKNLVDEVDRVDRCIIEGTGIALGLRQIESDMVIRAVSKLEIPFPSVN